MANEYVEENPVDEVLYPSYDEAKAEVLDLYNQYGSAASQHVQRVGETADIRKAEGVQAVQTGTPSDITGEEAAAATDDLSDIIDLVSSELAIMEVSRENHIAMTENMMTQYLTAMQEGLPYLEKYVDSRLASLDGGAGGSRATGPATDGLDGLGGDGPSGLIDPEAVATALGKDVDEIFPNRDEPLDSFDWDNPLGGRKGGKTNLELLAGIYGIVNNWDDYYEKELQNRVDPKDPMDASGEANLIPLTGLNQSDWLLITDKDNNPILSPLFRDYQTMFTEFMSAGATVEWAESLTWEALQTPEWYGPDFERAAPEDKGRLQNFAKIQTDAVYVEHGRQDMVEPLTPKEAEGMNLSHEDTYRLDEDTGLPERRVARKGLVGDLERYKEAGEVGEEDVAAGYVPLDRYGLGDEYSIDSVSLTDEQLKEWRSIEKEGLNIDGKQYTWDKIQSEEVKADILEAQQDFLKPIAEAQDIASRGEEFYRRSATEHGLLPGEHEDVGWWEDLWWGKDKGADLTQEQEDALADFSHRVPEDTLRHLSDAEQQSARDYATQQRGGRALGELMRDTFPKVEERIGSIGAGLASAPSAVMDRMRGLRDRDDFDELYAQALADKKAREQEALMRLAAQSAEWDAVTGAPRFQPTPAPATNVPRSGEDYAGFKIF